MTGNAVLAPIALFVYKRSRHTKATLDALARNLFASESDLFVFCDGPKNETDADAVEATRKIIRRAHGFKSVTLIERPHNLGLAKSVITGVSALMQDFENVIVLEDDLLTSKNFLTFMNQALSHYEKDAKAFSVTGHTFPAEVLTIPTDYPYDTYAGYRCSSWSWGTWRDRWQRIDWGMNYFPAFIRDREEQDIFNRGGEDLTPMLNLQYEKKIDSWAIRFAYAHHLYDARCIYPTRTLVRNIGLDNSGTHSRQDRRFLHGRLHDEWLPGRFVPAEYSDEVIARNFRAIFDAPLQTVKGKVGQKLNRLNEILIARLKIFGRKIGQPKNVYPDDTDVLLVNTLQKSGGAARAAHRCFEGIKRLYPRARYLNLFNEVHEDGAYGLDRHSFHGKLAQRLSILDRLPLPFYPKRQRVIFSPAFWANPLRIPILDFKPQLVHLHWVGVGMLEVEELPDWDVPVVWTLHDQWPFSGGCHYADECDKFTQQCGACPLLGSNNTEDISHTLWLRKLNAYGKTDLTVVAPTRWMADMARQSSLFANKRIEVIPNGLDTDVFFPMDKAAAKQALGVVTDRPALLFGAHVITDKRKGGDLLAAALAQIDFPCTLITFGEGRLPLQDNPNIVLRELGSVAIDTDLANMYSAADVFICPSRVDNLPNTVAEALACGTPCVAFNIAGLPDMIEHGVNGWLAEPFESSGLLQGISWVAQHADPAALRTAAREKAMADYSLSVMATRHQQLYSELLSRNAA